MDLTMIIGIAIVLITGYFVVKRHEIRMVMFLSGVAMFAVSGDIRGAVAQFINQVTNTGLVGITTTVMGFAYVCKVTECDKHLVRLLTNPLKKAGPILIPGTVIVTALINVALTSAAGVSAAVGAIMIPTLIAAGVKPVMAGAAVFAGTFGSLMSPGNAHNIYLAGVHTGFFQRILDRREALLYEGYTYEAVNAMGYTYEAAAAAEAAYGHITVVDIALSIAPSTIVAILVGATVLTAYAIITKENRGHNPEDWLGEADISGSDPDFRVNFLKALIPILPLIMLILGSDDVLGPRGLGLIAPAINVPQAMFFGALLAFLATCTDKSIGLTKIVTSFWEGMAYAFLNVSILIASAFTFAQGLGAVGITGAITNAMQNAEGAVAPIAVLVPMLISGLTGSGDGATQAFNTAVTPNAELFGISMMNLGNAANIGGALGRTLSPFAGGAIVCAAIAKVDPIDMAKRNFPGMIVAAIVVIVMAII